MLWAVIGVVGVILIVAVVLCLGCLYFTGQHILNVEAQRDAYKRVALLAIDEGKKVQGLLDELVEAVLEGREGEGPVGKKKSKGVGKSWD